MNEIVISGSGYHHPEESISNLELVNTYNEYVKYYNKLHETDIQKNIVSALNNSSAEFIEHVSGIKSRYVRDKKNLIDYKKMWPYLPNRHDDELSPQAETSVIAARMAMDSANKSAANIDAVILASSHKQRDFPSVSIEIQKELGIKGYAFDMGMACSSAVFGIHAAIGCIISGTANVVLVVSPEIKSGQFCTRDRESNFIFGEATSALIIERRSTSTAQHKFKISNVSLQTTFSNNIRNNRGAYNNCDPDNIFSRDKFFYQNGRNVFKDILTLVPKHISQQLQNCSITPQQIDRFWLHQANIRMHRSIITRLVGDTAYNTKLCPEILSEFGNTSSSGAIIAFSKFHKDLHLGAKCILCAFGAGYAVGSILLEKVT